MDWRGLRKSDCDVVTIVPFEMTAEDEAPLVSVLCVKVSVLVFASFMVVEMIRVLEMKRNGIMNE